MHARHTGSNVQEKRGNPVRERVGTSGQGKQDTREIATRIKIHDACSRHMFSACAHTYMCIICNTYARRGRTSTVTRLSIMPRVASDPVDQESLWSIQNQFSSCICGTDGYFLIGYCYWGADAFGLVLTYLRQAVCFHTTHTYDVIRDTCIHLYIQNTYTHTRTYMRTYMCVHTYLP